MQGLKWFIVDNIGNTYGSFDSHVDALDKLKTMENRAVCKLELRVVEGVN